MKIGGAIHRTWRTFALAASALVSSSLVAAEPPTNTNFANASVLIGTYFELSAAPLTNNAGSPEVTVPAESWWRWTAPESGRVSIRRKAQTPHIKHASETVTTAWSKPTYDATNGWPADAVIQIRTPYTVTICSCSQMNPGPWGTFGSVPNGSLSVFEGLDSEALDPVGNWVLPLETVFLLWQQETQQEEPAFEVQEGRTYSFRAMVDYESQEFSLLFTAHPPNDRFADRTVLVGVEVAGQGNNFLARLDEDSPLGLTGGLGRAVWWSWTPPESGDLNLQFVGEKMVIRVFHGESPATLELIARIENPAEMPYQWGLEPVAKRRTLIPVQKGVPLQFAVDSVGEVPGFDYSIKLRLEVAPPTIQAGQSRRLADGSFFLKAQNLGGRDVTLYRSSDLVNWTWIWRGIVNGDEVSFAHLDVEYFGQAFYSVRLTPSEDLQYSVEGPPQTP